MTHEVRVARDAVVRIVSDCRVPNGYMLSPEYVERYMAAMQHVCTTEKPCDVRRSEEEAAS